MAMYSVQLSLIPSSLSFYDNNKREAKAFDIIRAFRKQIPLEAAVASFYILREVMEKKRLRLRAAVKTRLYETLMPDYNLVTDLLYAAFEDYIPLAIVSELRYANSMATKHVRGLIRPYAKELANKKLISYYDEAFYSAIRFDRDAIAKAGEVIFDEKHGWGGGGYGGGAWQRIATAYLRRKQLPRELWVQQASSLAHNGGYMFGKGAFFQFTVRSYTGLMNYRNWNGGIYGINRLLNVLDLESLRVLPKSNLLPTRWELSYEPLEWGKEKLVIVR